MGELNGGRPLPWVDCPTCPACLMPTMVPVRSMGNGHGGGAKARIACSFCGIGRRGSPRDVAQAERAERAYELHLAGKIHEDRGCARCNGPLLLERFRLCEGCVEQDNAARQVPLFPEVAHAP